VETYGSPVKNFVEKNRKEDETKKEGKGIVLDVVYSSSQGSAPPRCARCYALREGLRAAKWAAAPPWLNHETLTPNP